MNPITIKNEVDALVTVTPWRCTSCGSSGMATCSLFCTCTWAMSGLTPFWKLKLMLAWPLAWLVADR